MRDSGAHPPVASHPAMDPTQHHHATSLLHLDHVQVSQAMAAAAVASPLLFVADLATRVLTSILTAVVTALVVGWVQRRMAPVVVRTSAPPSTPPTNPPAAPGEEKP